MHHGHTSEIMLLSDSEATGTWAMEDMLWWPAEKGGQHLWGVGWYFEKYRKCEDGEWRIQELKLRRIRIEIDGKQVFPPE